EDDWSRRGCRVCCLGRIGAPHRRDHGHMTAHEIIGKGGQSIVLAIGPAILDRRILALSPVMLAAAGCLRPHFGWSLRLGSSPTFALGHPKLLSLVPAQHRAATTQTSRRPTGAGGGEERSHQACCP